MSGAEEEPGFLARWSRRKRAAEAPPAEAPDAPEALAPLAPPPSACPIPNGPAIDLAALPKLEDLTIASDLGPFLRPGVPAALRDAALRRMWSLDPAIRDFIGCVEYQWDFNTPGGLPNGFSNTLIGDAAKLLDQAIGRVVESVAPPEPEIEAQPAEPPVVTIESTPTPRLAEMREEARPHAPRVEVEQPAGLLRRRHGSALPG
jgi:hypothetical protein